MNLARTNQVVTEIGEGGWIKEHLLHAGTHAAASAEGDKVAADTLEIGIAREPALGTEFQRLFEYQWVEQDITVGHADGSLVQSLSA